MKDRRSDGLLILFVLVALCVETAVLLHQLRLIELPISLDRTPLSEAPVGEIIEKNNVLKNRTLRSLSWYPMATGDRVGRNDTLMTGPESSAKVRLENGGLIEIESDTLISFGVERTLNGSAPLTLLVDQGALKVQSAQESVMVRVQKKEIKLDADSQITVSRAPLQKEARISVQKGRVEVAKSEARAEAIAIKAGDTVVMGAAEIKKIPPPLNISPEFPLPGARLVMQSPELTALFKWKGDGAEKIEIDRQPSFTTAESFPARELQADVKLTSGKYFWRVSKPGVTGPSYDLIVLPAIGYALVTPLKDAQLKSDLRIRLQWDAIEAASRYLVQVSKEADFSDPLIEKAVDEPQFDAGILGEGQYFWRIRAEHKELGPWPYSESSSFTVKKPLGAPKLKGVKLIEKPTSFNPIEKFLDWILPTAHAAEKPPVPEKPREAEVAFEWESIPGAVGYHFQMSEKEDFSSAIVELDSSAPSIKQKVILKKKYFWRVAGRDAQGDLGAYSATEPFLIQEPPKPKAPEKPAPPKPEPKKEEPKPAPVVKMEAPPPLGSTLWIRGGISGVQHYERIRTPTFDTTQKGFLPNRFPFAAAWSSGNREVQLRVALAEQRFSPKSSVLQDVQPNLTFDSVNAALWFKGFLAPKKRPPFIFGLSYRERPAFIRTGYESIGIESVRTLGGIIGPSWFYPLTRWWSLRTDLLLEVYPFGQMRGMALFAEATLGTKWRFLGFTPELQVNVTPAYYTITPDVQEGKSLDFSVALLLRWNLSFAQPAKEEALSK